MDIKGFTRMAGLGAALAAMAGLWAPAAQAQANALTPPAAGEAMGGYGISLMDPADLKSVVEGLGLTIEGTVPVPNKQGVMTVALAGGQIPFLFVHTACVEAGCLFLEMIQPVPIANAGLSLTSDDINDFNRGGNFVMLTEERDGEIAIRYTLPAAEGCDSVCLRSHVGLYAEAVFFTHDHLQGMAQKSLVSLDPRSFFPAEPGTALAKRTRLADGFAKAIAPADAASLSGMLDHYMPGTVQGLADTGTAQKKRPSIGTAFPALLPQ